MKNIILFKFHKDPLVCKNKLDILRKYNPGLEIFGLYGGEVKKLDEMKKMLGSYLKDIYSIQDKTPEWKWKNGDLSVAEWYKKVGKNVEFDSLFVIEWDLLILEPLEKTYEHVSENSVALTGLRPLKGLEGKWDWITEEPQAGEWRRLLAFVEDKYDYDKEPLASLGPGSLFPREFLERYSSENIPELAHEELRLPLFAQVFGFSVVDTKFYKKWFDDEEQRYFNCLEKEIDEKLIVSEIKKSNGRRVFHPFTKVFGITNLRNGAQ